MIKNIEENPNTAHDEHDEEELEMCTHPRPRHHFPEIPITEIETIRSDKFSIGDKVYYIHPNSMYTIKRSTIKNFKHYSGILYSYDVVLNDGAEVFSNRIFHTLADAQSAAIQNLERQLNQDRNQLTTIERRIAINERIIARLQKQEPTNNESK